LIEPIENFQMTSRISTCSATQARQSRRPLGILGAVAMAAILGSSGCDDGPRIQLPEHLNIEVRGKERLWTARYPGADGTIQTADDVLSRGKVYVPVGVPVTLHLRSDDLIYIFSLPSERLQTIAVPDLEYELSMTASETGTYDLEGGTMCGRPNTTHGTFAAIAKNEFLDWYATSTK
jgi:heme/copper-type cytochrome/quinol oxidase subunit 2